MAKSKKWSRMIAVILTLAFVVSSVPTVIPAEAQVEPPREFKAEILSSVIDVSTLSPEGGQWAVYWGESCGETGGYWSDTNTPYAGNTSCTHQSGGVSEVFTRDAGWIPGNTDNVLIQFAYKLEPWGNPGSFNTRIEFLSINNSVVAVSQEIANGGTTVNQWQMVQFYLPGWIIDSFRNQWMKLAVVTRLNGSGRVVRLDEIGAYVFWPDAQPTATPIPTSTPPPSTSTPRPPTATPTRTQIPTITPTRTATRPPTATPTRTATFTPIPLPIPCPAGGCKKYLPLIKKQGHVQCHPGWWGYWSEVVETFPSLAARTNVPETILIPGNIGLDGFIDIGDPVCIPNDPDQAWFEENALTAFFNQPRSRLVAATMVLVALDGPLPFGDAVAVGNIAREGITLAKVVKLTAPAVGVGTIAGWLGLQDLGQDLPLVNQYTTWPVAPNRYNRTADTRYQGLQTTGEYYISPWDGRASTLPDEVVEAVWIDKPDSSLHSGGFVLGNQPSATMIFPQRQALSVLRDYAITRGNGHCEDTNSGIGRPEMRRADAGAIAAAGVATPLQCWKKSPEPGRWGAARALVYQTSAGIVTFLHNLDTTDRTFLRGNIPEDDNREFDQDWRMVTASNWEPCDPVDRNLVLMVLDEVLDYLGIPHSPVGQQEVNKPE